MKQKSVMFIKIPKHYQNNSHLILHLVARTLTSLSCVKCCGLQSQQTAAASCCQNMKQVQVLHCRGTAFCGLRSLQFVVAKGHNIWEVIESLFTAQFVVAEGHNIVQNKRIQSSLCHIV